MLDRKRQAFGILAALTGGSLWGFSGACAQFLMGTYGVSAGFVTSARMLGAGVLFVVWLAIARRDSLARLLRDREAVRGVAIFGGVGLFLSQITYLVAIDCTNAGTATVLQATSMVFVMLGTCALARKLPTARDAAGLGLAVVATWLIATHGEGMSLALPLPGLLWGMANGLSCAFYIMYPKRLLARWGSLLVTGVGMLVGGVVSAVLLARPWNEPLARLDGAGWAALAAIVLLGTAAAYALYIKGIAEVGSVRAALLGVAEPASATLCSWAWLGTPFSPADVAGFALMAGMLVVVSTGRKD